MTRPTMLAASKELSVSLPEGAVVVAEGSGGFGRSS